MTCNHGVALIAITITLVHYGNWWVTKLYESKPNEAYLSARAAKNCLPDRYRTKTFTQVYFPIDYIPPSAARTDNTPDVRVLAC